MKTFLWYLGIGSVVAAVLLVLITCVLIVSANAHEHSRPELNGWFDTLKSAKGPCCSNADGTALADVDWETKDKHYRVRVEGHWWDVPDEAVITEPNRDGRTIVWPVRYTDVDGSVTIAIRCFMPGSMT